MLEKRVPKKGEGVPKETPSQNSITELRAAMVRHFPQLDWADLNRALISVDFFQAGMQQQVHLMAQIAIQMLPETERPNLIAALSASSAEKVRGVAAVAVPLVHPNDHRQQLNLLRTTGILPGTWPRELSVVILHKMIIDLGVEAIWRQVHSWILDPEPAVRRLVVEAFRPRGVMVPHIKELKEDPAPLRALLEGLLDDESEYVRKAVANNINDVSRDNPEIVLTWAQQWLLPTMTPARTWILNRGLRTLIGQNHPNALSLLGYGPASNVTVRWRDTTPQQIEINQLIPLEFSLHNSTLQPQRLLLMLFMDAPGKREARRQFKYQLWRGTLNSGEQRVISKRVHFVDKTTQLKEAGVYYMTVVVNGESLAMRSFSFAR